MSKRIITVVVVLISFACRGNAGAYALMPNDSIVIYKNAAIEAYNAKDYRNAYANIARYIEIATDEEKETDGFRKLMGYRTELADKLEKIAEKAYSKAAKAEKSGKNELADSLYKHFMWLCVSPQLRAKPEYTNALTRKALNLQTQGQINAAIDILGNVATHNKDDLKGLAVTYVEAANAYFNKNEYDNAITNYAIAKELYAKAFGRKSDDYGTVLNNMASALMSRNAQGDLLQAQELYKEAVRILDKKSETYSAAVNSLSMCYTFTGNQEKDNKIDKLVDKSIKKIDTLSIRYASILSNRSVSFAHEDNYAEAVANARKAISIFQYNEDIYSLNYARLLLNTATYEKHLENYDAAIELLNQAASVYKTIVGDNGLAYMECMNEMASIYLKKGDLQKAADINESLFAADRTAVTDNMNYSHALTMWAANLAAEGNYKEAMELSEKALLVLRQYNDRGGEANVLNELSGYLFHLGEVEAAIDTCKRALNICGETSEFWETKALALNNLSLFYHNAGQEDLAIQYSGEAIKQYESIGRQEDSFYAKILANKAFYESIRDSLHTAITLETKAIDILQRVLGSEHPDLVMQYFNVANYYLRQGDKSAATQSFHKALELQSRQVRSNFSHLSTRGREIYWGERKYVFNAAPYLAYLMSDKDSMLIDTYNSLLFTKGILLNSEIDFKRFLARTASKELQDAYTALAAIQNKIEIAWRNPQLIDTVNINEMMTTATRLERQLIRDCKEFGDFTEAMTITYEQVATALSDDEAAIEFFDLNIEGVGKTYMALLARRGWPAPQLIKLFNDFDMRDVRFAGLSLEDALKSPEGVNAVFADSIIGDMVWANIAERLDGVNNIYFSPSGLFHQWGIEYLQYNGHPICEEYAIHRISSTKDLVQSHDNNSISRNAVIYGGLDYNASFTDIQLADERLSKEDENFLAFFDIEAMQELAEDDVRAVDGFMRANQRSVSYLPGTLKEAELIGECLMQQDIDTKMYIGTDGTESSFKSLSGSNIGLIHVATHGFCLNEDETRGKTQQLAYLDIAKGESVQVDNSLCFSGLLLAGANNVLKEMSVPDGMENGILTAREIASMDFRGTDMVVLSACQTGLGQLREEGVFGLQRGFKKAGVHSLLMSLWSVSDNATQIIMTAFYEGLASGKTKIQAFRDAQRTVRENGFTDPFYWASFVLLDD